MEAVANDEHAEHLVDPLQLHFTMVGRYSMIVPNIQKYHMNHSTIQIQKHLCIYIYENKILCMHIATEYGTKRNNLPGGGGNHPFGGGIGEFIPNDCGGGCGYLRKFCCDGWLCGGGGGG